MSDPNTNGENGDFRDDKGRFTDGNPGGPGRPKGFSLVDILKRELQKQLEGTTKTQAEQIIEQYVKEHMLENTDRLAIENTIDRIDGRAVAKQEITGKDGEPITLKIEFDEPDDTD